MKDNFVFKVIDISDDSLFKITEEINKYYTAIADVVDTTSSSSHVYNVKLNDIFKKCPSLIQYLTILNCGSIKEIKFIFAFPKEIQVPHIDYCDKNGNLTSESYLALNFPVQNCSETTTCFYKPVDGEKRIRYLGPGFRAAINTIDKWQSIGSYSLQQPTLINTNLYHKMINTTNNIRISFSVRFKNDPWHLIND
jgi:hypothetical protein